MTWFRFNKTENKATEFWNSLVEKLWRNWSGFAALYAIYYLPKMHFPPSMESNVSFMVGCLYVTVIFNVVLFMATNIKWRKTTDENGKDLPELVIASNRIFMGLVFLGICGIYAFYNQGKDKNTNMETLNEELNPTKKVLLDSTVQNQAITDQLFIDSVSQAREADSIRVQALILKDSLLPLK